MNTKIKKSVLALSAIFGCIWIYNTYSKPTISVVMPTYNREQMLPRAIDSILDQTYKDFELIIVDDASTDKSVEVIKDYMKKDKRIRLIQNEKNSGIAFSRNRGNDAARGKYIAIMDSDDQSLPHRLELSINFFEKHPDVDAFCGNLLDIEEPVYAQQFLNWQDYKIASDEHALSMMFSNTFYNVASMFKRDFVKKHNIRYNNKYVSAEDYDFWKQFVMKNGKLVSINSPITFVRKHRTNVESYYTKMGENAAHIQNELISRFLDEIPERPSQNDLINKCFILEKIEQANIDKNVMPQKEIKKYKDRYCPTDLKSSFLLIHPNWKYFLTTNGDKCRVWNGDLEGTFKKEDDILTIDWKQYPTEMFKKHPEGDVYLYLPDTHYHVEHKGWTDLLIEKDKDTNHFCRFSRGDCGKLIHNTPQKIQIKWDNPAYEIETFIFDKKKEIYIQQ